jgi:hypothetical protein
MAFRKTSAPVQGDFVIYLKLLLGVIARYHIGWFGQKRKDRVAKPRFL